MWRELNARIIACARCSRLRRHCEKVAREKRRAFQDWEYWGKPITGFGDPDARLLILGLAPAAHGANRTGRIFTGDRSGDFLFASLYRAGFASQPTSTSINDGLTLKDCYITASVRCAPPDNKPTPREIKNCRPYLEEELKLLKKVQVVLVLGKIAFDTYMNLLADKGVLKSRSHYDFRHGALYELPDLPSFLTISYHPSQQNTQTGKLTPAMMDDVLKKIILLLRSPAPV